MLRLVCLAAALFVTSAHADEREILTDPADVSRVTAGSSTALSYYSIEGDLLRVTMLVSDEDGETILARVGLADGQQHVVLLVDQDDVPGPTIVYHRIGSTIEVSTSDGPSGTAIASWF